MAEQFWALIVQPGEVAKINLDDKTPCSLHVTQCALQSGSAGKTSLEICCRGLGKTRYTVATLNAKSLPHAAIDLTFFPDDEGVAFIATGDAPIHLLGVLVCEVDDEGEEGEEGMMAADGENGNEMEQGDRNGNTADFYGDEDDEEDEDEDEMANENEIELQIAAAAIKVCVGWIEGPCCASCLLPHMHTSAGLSIALSVLVV